MATLEELLPGARVTGLGGGAPAEIVSVSLFGPDAVNVVFRVNGTVGERLVYRDEAAVLTLHETGSRFGFDADGRAGARGAPELVGAFVAR